MPAIAAADASQTICRMRPHRRCISSRLVGCNLPTFSQRRASRANALIASEHNLRVTVLPQRAATVDAALQGTQAQRRGERCASHGRAQEVKVIASNRRRRMHSLGELEALQIEPYMPLVCLNVSFFHSNRP